LSNSDVFFVWNEIPGFLCLTDDQLDPFKGCDFNFEVILFFNFKSRYK